VRLGPTWQRVVAEHVEYEPGHLFADRMIEGPFAEWYHRHVVTPTGPDESMLTDEITYRLPLGAVGELFGGWYARAQLERLFDFRHEVTRKAVEK
ncbi:MAG: cyclase, partial [Myxococcota bacterium]